MNDPAIVRDSVFLREPVRLPPGAARARGSDAELFARWQGGDAAAGDQLCRRYIAPLTTMFRRRGFDEPDELVQRVLLACVRGRDRFRGDAAFRTFVYSIARNVIGDVRRQQRTKAARQEALPPQEPADLSCPSLAEQLAVVEALRDLAFAWERLSEEEQTLLTGYVYEGESGPDLAASLGISLPALRSRLRRARARLKSRPRPAASLHVIATSEEAVTAS